MIVIVGTVEVERVLLLLLLLLELEKVMSAGDSWWLKMLSIPKHTRNRVLPVAWGKESSYDQMTVGMERVSGVIWPQLKVDKVMTTTAGVDVTEHDTTNPQAHTDPSTPNCVRDTILTKSVTVDVSMVEGERECSHSGVEGDWICPQPPSRTPILALTIASRKGVEVSMLEVEGVQSLNGCSWSLIKWWLQSSQGHTQWRWGQPWTVPSLGSRVLYIALLLHWTKNWVEWSERVIDNVVVVEL